MSMLLVIHNEMKKYLTILIILLVPFLFIGQEIEAGSEHNVTGWAWAENFGWISMNNTNHSGSVNYGVHVGTDYNLTGYAWNNYDDGGIGWIDFDPASGFPESPSSSVALDPDTGEITGWARAISYGDGWDGWIKMYDTELVSGEITGWGWGGDVVGWISFNCLNEDECGTSDYQVEVDFSPKPVINNPETVSNYDTGLRKKGAITFYWTYDAGNTSSASSYDLQIATDSAYNNVVIDRTDIPQVLSPGEQGSSLIYINHPAEEGEQLQYDTPYYWRVRVKDSEGIPSDWLVDINNPITTEPYPWPYTVFDWLPTHPIPGETVTFDAEDSEIFFDVDNPETPDHYCWLFDGYVGENICYLNPSDPAEEICSYTLYNPVTDETEQYCFTQSIVVLDTDFNLTEARCRTYDCSTGVPINMKWGTLVFPVNPALPQPTWREVSPY